ncbi:MarR family winged helix-turn-helix transcriptional regulator [Saccharothrix sp. AJ9571]|nr:MarR family winged helix-turn-helix transcriptional regulator [Saccharothrix sp. AJ9571]
MHDEQGQPVAYAHILVTEAVGTRARGGEVTIGAAGAELDVDESTASRFVTAAHAAGYLDRARSIADARRKVLVLTPAGERLRERAAAARRRILSALLHGWSSGDRDVLAGLVSRFAADLPARHRRRLAPASGHR